MGKQWVFIYIASWKGHQFHTNQNTWPRASPPPMCDGFPRAQRRSLPGEKSLWMVHSPLCLTAMPFHWANQGKVHRLPEPEAQHHCLQQIHYSGNWTQQFQTLDNEVSLLRQRPLILQRRTFSPLICYLTSTWVCISNIQTFYYFFVKTSICNVKL